MTVFEALVEVMLVIVRGVLWFAPAGVLALGFQLGARVGAGALGALLHYVLVICLVGLGATLLGYVLAAGVGRMSVFRFARAVMPAQGIALGTQSSLATLPIMIESAPALGASSATSGIVLPMAVAMFRAASAAANVAVTVYLAQLFGVPLPLQALLLLASVAAVVSLAAVGLPAQVSFFATIGPVCLAVGVPLTALPLLLAVESFPDVFRTLGNVTNDMALTRILARSQPGGPIPVAQDGRDTAAA